MRSLPASAYIGLVIAGGAAFLAYGLTHWQTADLPRYLCLAALAVFASHMKVTLPAITGTMSMNFLFVLIGIAHLSQAETLAMGSAGMLVQCIFQTRRRPRIVQVAFSVASVACSTAPAYQVYHVPLRALGSTGEPLLLLFAAATYYLVNTLSIAFVIALTESKNPWTVWRDSYFWSFPNYLVGAAVAWALNLVSRVFGWQASLLLLPVLYVIYRSHRHYVDRLEEEKRRAEEQRNHAEEMAALHHRTIEALALAIEAKDRTTHDHLERVEVYAIEVGKDLGLSPVELQALRASALLHDIGKLAVPEHIISKPGKLTPEEFEKMKVHPVVGAEILEQVRFPYPVAPIVRSHHEKWNGSGYPDGLAGEQIPIGARILSAVDCLDALASDRQYRRALPLHEAIKVVEAESGKSFDPQVVEILARRYVELERMAKSGRAPADRMKLSTDLKIERGVAPAAGFEATGGPRDSNGDLVNLYTSIAMTNLLSKLDHCRTPDEVFARLREELRPIVRYDVMAVYARRGDQLIPGFLHGEDYSLFASLEIPLGMGLSGWVAKNGKPIVNGNPSVEPGYLNDPAKFSTLRSALAVPLESHSVVTGVVSLYLQDRDAFTKDHLNLMLSLAPKLAAILEQTCGPLSQLPPCRSPIHTGSETT